MTRTFFDESFSTCDLDFFRETVVMGKEKLLNGMTLEEFQAGLLLDVRRTFTIVYNGLEKAIKEKDLERVAAYVALLGAYAECTFQTLPDFPEINSMYWDRRITEKK